MRINEDCGRKINLHTQLNIYMAEELCKTFTANSYLKIILSKFKTLCALRNIYKSVKMFIFSCVFTGDILMPRVSQGWMDFEAKLVHLDYL